MKEKEKTKRCYFCSKVITKDVTLVLLGTYNRISKPDEENYFHFPCWVQYFNEQALKKSESLKPLAKLVTPQTAGMIKAFIGQNINQDGKRKPKTRKKK